MADETYVPPVIVEVVARAGSVKSVMAEADATVAAGARSMSASAAEAGLAAERTARAAGASATEQAAAAGRAAAAQQTASEKITLAQRAAADAARTTATAVGLSADEQVAAADRAILAQRRVEDAAAGQATTLERLGSLGKWALVGEAASGAVAVKLALDFQKSTAAIAANANIPVAAAKRISDAFLGTAGETQYSANTIATSYSLVARQLGLVQGSALNSAQSLAFMRQSMTLADATGQDLGTTTTALAAVLRSYGLGLSSASGATDVLFNVSRATQIPIGTLATTIDRLHARLGSLAPSLRDVGTLMTFPTVTAAGSRGALQVNSALTRLLGNTAPVNTALAELGVHLYDTNGKFVGLKDVIGQLQPALAGVTDQQTRASLETALFGSSSHLLMSIVQGGVSTWDHYSQVVGQAGSAHDAASKKAQTFGHEIEVLKASLVDLGIQLGNVLIPVLQSVVGAVQNVVDWFEKHKTAAEVLAGVIGGVLSTAISVFVFQKVKALVTGVGDMIGAFTKFTNYLLGNAPAIEGQLGKVATAGKGVGSDVQSGMQAAQNAVTDAQAPIAAASAADAAALTDEWGTPLATKMGAETTAAMDASKAAMVAAAPELEAESAAIGASLGSRMLLGFARVFTAAAILAITAEAVKGPLNSLSNDIHNWTGGALGSGISVGNVAKDSLTSAQAWKEAFAAAAQLQKLGISGETAQDFWQALYKAGAIMPKTAGQQAVLGVTGSGAAGPLPPGETSTQAAQQAGANAINNLLGPLQNVLLQIGPTKLASLESKESKIKEEAAKKAQEAIEKTQRTDAALQQQGMTELNTLLDAVHTKSLGQLNTLLNTSHQTKMDELVTKLDATHKASLVSLGGKITSEFSTVTSTFNTVAAALHAGSDELTRLVSADHQKGLAKLDIDLNATHKQAMDRVVSTLDHINSTASIALANRISSEWQAGIQKQNQMVSADTQAGQTKLAALHQALLTGSLSSLNAQLTISANEHLGKLVLLLEATHRKALVDMAHNIEAVYQKVVSADEQAQATAATVAYGKMEAAAAKAFDDLSNSLSTLYTASETIAQQPLTAAQNALTNLQNGGTATQAQLDAAAAAVAAAQANYNQVETTGTYAQEQQLGGSTGPGLLATLGPVLAALQAGGGSGTSDQYKQWAALFGNSELGTDFTSLAATGTSSLNAAETTSTLGNVDSVLTALVNLETALESNTAATGLNTGVVAAAGSVTNVGPSIAVYATDAQLGQEFADDLYQSLRPILTAA